MLYELRIYECVPGRLPDLLKRFDTITLKLWEKHGIKQAGFWTTVIGESNQTLYYFVVWESLAEREKKWNAVRRRSGMAQGARRDREERRDRRQREELHPGADRVLGGEVANSAAAACCRRCRVHQPNVSSSRLPRRKSGVSNPSLNQP